MKNYKQPKGLSFRLFDEVQEHPYLISGPFGKGLGHHTSGIHIAFAAGTGVLTFMDLVGRVSR